MKINGFWLGFAILNTLNYMKASNIFLGILILFAMLISFNFAFENEKEVNDGQTRTIRKTRRTNRKAMEINKKNGKSYKNSGVNNK